MTFQPTIVGSGLVGWRFLQATMETQQTSFERSNLLQRDIDYFKENIGTVSSAEELVNNRRLLGVALSAFGLEDKIDSKFLLKKVLEEGTEDGALANRLNDGRFVAFAGAFKFEPELNAKTREPGFADNMLAKYEEKVLAKMEAGLAESGDTDTNYGNSVREQVKLSIERESAVFRDAIGAVESADDLMKNPRLLLVALNAFGLEDKVRSTTLLKGVLEQGTGDPTDLANVLGDERYVELAKAFEFDRPTVNPMQDKDFIDGIIGDYKTHEFEVAVGNVDENLRFALNFDRAIPQLANNGSSENTKWFNVLGTTSLRKVFEAAIGLPSSFAQLDIDKQLEVMQDKMKTRFGVEEFKQVAEPEIQSRIVESFLLQSQIQANVNTGSQQTALTLLQAIPRNSLF
jgi:hypothetical protein